VEEIMDGRRCGVVCAGALGDWDGAMVEYLAAAKDSSMKDIAMANYALALFQTGQDQAAIKEAKQLLRRDPQFWDMRAATVALYAPTPHRSIRRILSHNHNVMITTPVDVLRLRGGWWVRGGAPPTIRSLWGTGDEAGAESEYETLKGLGGGLGAALYSSTDRVRARWPPRCTAALEAFFRLERSAEALDYDGERRRFSFE